MSNIGDRLRLARERKGLKQTQVKDHTGINNKTLSGYENGVSEPDLQSLSTLASLYEVSVDWLIGRSSVSNDRIPKSSRPRSEAEALEQRDELFDEAIRDAVTPEERALIEFVRTTAGDTFFSEFSGAPEERKERFREILRDQKMIWEMLRREGK